MNTTDNDDLPCFLDWIECQLPKLLQHHPHAIKYRMFNDYSIALDIKTIIKTYTKSFLGFFYLQTHHDDADQCIEFVGQLTDGNFLLVAIVNRLESQEICWFSTSSLHKLCEFMLEGAGIIYVGSFLQWVLLQPDLCTRLVRNCIFLINNVNRRNWTVDKDHDLFQTLMLRGCFDHSRFNSCKGCTGCTGFDCEIAIYKMHQERVLRIKQVINIIALLDKHILIHNVNEIIVEYAIIDKLSLPNKTSAELFEIENRIFSKSIRSICQSDGIKPFDCNVVAQSC